MADELKSRAKWGILSCALLMMGAMAIASGLSAIAENFPHLPQTTIQLLITLPCIVIIIATPIIGKLQEYISSKTLLIFGVLCFLIGGVLPAYMQSFTLILIMRAVVGIGVASVQVLCPALVSAFYETEEERSAVMGQVGSAQMIGTAITVLVSGYLAVIGWNTVFYVHLIALVSLIGALLFLPSIEPMRSSGAGQTPQKVTVSLGGYGWAVTMLLFFVAGMVLATFMAFFITARGLGTPAHAGQATTLFALGGFFMGFLYGKLAQWTKNAHLALAAGLFMGFAAYLIIFLAQNLYLAYLGSFIYGFAVTTVYSAILVGTSLAVEPIAIPLATSFVIAGQNLGSFLCPYIMTPLAAILGTEINIFVFLAAALWLGVMAIVALLWGLRKLKTKIPA